MYIIVRVTTKYYRQKVARRGVRGGPRSRSYSRLHSIPQAECGGSSLQLELVPEWK